MMSCEEHTTPTLDHDTLEHAHTLCQERLWPVVSLLDCLAGTEETPEEEVSTTDRCSVARLASERVRALLDELDGISLETNPRNTKGQGGVVRQLHESSGEE